MVKLPVLCGKRQEAKIVNDRMSLGTLGVREGKGLNNTGNMWSGRKKGNRESPQKSNCVDILGWERIYQENQNGIPGEKGNKQA